MHLAFMSDKEGKVTYITYQLLTFGTNGALSTVHLPINKIQDGWGWGEGGRLSMP